MSQEKPDNCAFKTGAGMALRPDMTIDDIVRSLCNGRELTPELEEEIRKQKEKFDKKIRDTNGGTKTETSKLGSLIESQGINIQTRIVKGGGKKVITGPEGRQITITYKDYQEVRREEKQLSEEQISARVEFSRLLDDKDREADIVKDKAYAEAKRIKQEGRDERERFRVEGDRVKDEAYKRADSSKSVKESRDIKQKGRDEREKVRAEGDRVKDKAYDEAEIIKQKGRDEAERIKQEGKDNAESFLEESGFSAEELGILIY